jgi:8-oxo-dGTP diphosphatase
MQYANYTKLGGPQGCPAAAAGVGCAGAGLPHPDRHRGRGAADAARGPPFAGALALPGGYVRVDEDAGLEAAARRVLRTKANLAPRYLEQLGTFGGAGRDPRGWSLSVSYYVLLSEAEAAAAALHAVPADALPALPFDHAAIVAAALRRLRGKSTYSSLPAFLLPPLFTLGELHRVYEQVIGTRLDPASFRRKIEDQRIIEKVAGQRREGAHRPAQLFRLVPDSAPEFDRRI